MAYMGQKFGLAVIEALGLPKHTRWFELRVAHDEPVTIKCEYLPDEPELDEEGNLISMLAEYTLQEKEATPCD